jgi:hypothetical protein
MNEKLAELEQDAEPRDSTRSIVRPLALMAICLLAVVVSRPTSPIAVTTFVAVVGVVWILLYRFAHLGELGLAFWCAGVTGISLAVALSKSVGEFPSGILSVFSVLLIPAAAIAFLVAASKSPPGRVANCAGCVIAIFTLVLPLAASHVMSSRLGGIPERQRVNRTLILLHQLGADVEVFRNRHGRFPKDEAELVSFRGKPMPVYRGDSRVTYCLHADGSYELHCMIYDWIIQYYGPHSPQRIHAEFF